MDQSCISIRNVGKQFAARNQTIEALREATEGDPRHALRLALCGIFKPVTEVSDAIRTSRYNDVDLMLDQFCKIQQFALPLFLRRIVSKGVANNLPEGLTVHRLNLRTERLSEMVTGRTLQTVSLADLVDGLLGKQETGSSFGSGGFSSSYAASVECRERFRAILAADVVHVSRPSGLRCRPPCVRAQTGHLRGLRVRR